MSLIYNLSLKAVCPKCGANHQPSRKLQTLAELLRLAGANAVIAESGVQASYYTTRGDMTAFACAIADAPQLPQTPIAVATTATVKDTDPSRPTIMHLEAVFKVIADRPDLGTVDRKWELGAYTFKLGLTEAAVAMLRDHLTNATADEGECEACHI